MKLLANERDYKRWATGRDGWDTYKSRWRSEAPTQYPCWAYTVVRDWGMEEERPMYLYLADTESMHVALQSFKEASA